MYHFVRAVLLSMFWVTAFFIVPYAFFSYICYAGLCGGDLVAEIRQRPHFVTLYGYYIWLYPLIGFVVMVYSRKLRNKFIAILVLFVPFLCGIPFGYIYYQENLIKSEIKVSREKYFHPQPADFICSPNTFIRTGDPTSMSVFHKAYNKFDDTVYFNIAADFDNSAELVKYLSRENIDISNCKNANGVSFKILP